MRPWRMLLWSVFLAGAVALPAASAPVVTHYREAVSQDGFSTTALSGLGDAWLRAGHPGRAILQYQRALVLAPQDPALEQALARARERAGVSIAPPGSWARAAGVLSDDTWAWIEAMSVLMLCGALALLACGKAGRWAKMLALAGACGVVLATDVIVLRWPELGSEVVVKGPAEAHIAPADAAATSFELRDGESVYPEDRFEDFQRVRTLDGRSGWLHRGVVAPVRVTAAEAAAEDLPP